MKRLTRTLSIGLVLWLLAASHGYSQTLSGRQTEAAEGKTKTECPTVQIDKVVTITQVSGQNAGFWIEKGGHNWHSFWKPNDSGVIGLKLQPGQYRVCPQLATGRREANVVLHYK